MKKGKVNYGLIIFLCVIVILFIPIISDYVKQRNLVVISSSELLGKIAAKESFLIYSGNIDKKTKKELRNLRDKTKNDYSYDYSVYVTEEKLNKDVFGENSVAAIIIEGDLQKTYEKYDVKVLENDVDAHLLVDINDDNKYYKIVSNFSKFKKLVKSKEVSMFVLGRDTCYYCNKYKPVYNSLAAKYNFDVYYFDSDSYNSKEYSKIVNIDLTVPAKCSSSKKDFKLSDGFGTPLTIFTKNNEIVDCISGYVGRSNLLEKLNNLKMISE